MSPQLAGRVGPRHVAPGCAAPGCAAPGCAAPGCAAPGCAAPGCAAPARVARVALGSWLTLTLGGVSLGCDDRQRDLAYLPAAISGTDAGPVEVPESIAGIETTTIARVANERPLGAASLGPGTNGGGTFEDAVRTGSWVEVRSPEEFDAAVTGDAPRIVLIHPGVYDLGEPESYTVSACRSQCPSGTSPTSELVPAGKCTSDTDVETAATRARRLRVGSNKTLLGLGQGATLDNVELNLSGSTNVIVRNLAIRNVNPGLVGFSNAITLWPSRHVWLDHNSFTTSSHTFINIHSDWDQESATYAVVEFASHITISFNSFDGTNSDNCGGQQNWGVGTQRDPALTIHNNLMQNAKKGFPYLFGSETWGHVYNNVLRGNQDHSVGVACGAQGIIEANVFEQSPVALHVGDEGLPSWPFCAAGLFGKAWFPYGDASDPAANLLDSGSGIDPNDQNIDGSGLVLPEVVGDARSVVPPGEPSGEGYTYSLEAVSSDWASALSQRVGVGRLF